MRGLKALLLYDKHDADSTVLGGNKTALLRRVLKLTCVKEARGTLSAAGHAATSAKPAPVAPPRASRVPPYPFGHNI